MFFKCNFTLKTLDLSLLITLDSLANKCALEQKSRRNVISSLSNIDEKIVPS